MIEVQGNEQEIFYIKHNQTKFLHKFEILEDY